MTRLSAGPELPKSDAHFDALGTVDEANCALGLALALRPPEGVATVLRVVQAELFDVGADLAGGGERLAPGAVERLEYWCDEFDATLPPLASFILPGGTPVAAQLHVARAVVRRAERAAWRIETVGHAPQRYLNRLSDLLFVLARHVAARSQFPDALWPAQQK